MKIIILISVLFTSSILSQVLKQPVSCKFSSQYDSPGYIQNQGIRENPLLIDTAGTVPGLTQYWDYVTNGNNLRKLWVMGDTVIVAADYTDSLNASLQTARRTYYQFTTNGGISWSSEAILIANSFTAYPDMVPVILSGSRTICITGAGAPLGGFAAIDVILGAGSFTRTNIQGGAIVSSLLDASYIVCVSSNANLRDSLFFRRFNYHTNIFTSPIFITTLQPNARYYLTTSSNGLYVFIMWWNSSPNELKARESTNGGNTFGPIITVCPSNVNINGDAVTPWYAADVVYRPGTVTPYAAFSTLAPGNFPTAQGSKVLMWSPAVNGGQPVKIADWRNNGLGFINDTANFNSQLRQIQVGITPLSNPSIAFSSNGNAITCAFSVVRSDTSIYGFHYNSIYTAFSKNNGQDWIRITQPGCAIPEAFGTDDKIYPSLSKTGNSYMRFHITYSLSENPGSASFTNTNTPVGKVYQIYKVICPSDSFWYGITTISSEIPKSFYLGQNYPNPFNPKTIIKFGITKASVVRISIFDITGREVTRLVRQKLNAGTYSIDFNGENLSSGVYFYSIAAGDFVMTKKMILIK